MLTDQLQQFGYSQKESKVYLALLELGTSPASTVARFTDENRVTAYSILKLLIKKGIVLESKKNGLFLYDAIDPRMLVEQQQVKYKQLESALPELLSLMNPYGKKPRITTFEGLEGMKNLLRQLVRDFQSDPEMEIHGFLGAKTMDPSFEAFLRNSLEVEKQKPIQTPTNIILVGNHSYWYADYCREKYNTKTVEELSFPMEHEMFTFKNKVVILMYRSEELSGVIIESRSLAYGIRSMFELVWKYAPDVRP